MILRSVQAHGAIRRVQDNVRTSNDNVARGCKSHTAGGSIASNSGDGEDDVGWEVVKKVLYDIVDAIDVEPRLCSWVRGRLDDVQAMPLLK